MSNKDKCGVTKNIIYEFLKKEKKKNSSILISGSKKFLCAQYLKHHHKPNLKHHTINNNNNRSPKKGMSEGSTVAALNVVKQWFKEMTTVAQMRDFNNRVRVLCEAEVIRLKLNNNIPNEKDVYDMFENNQPMKRIIVELNKITDQFDKEEVGLYAIDSKNFKNYTKTNRKKFIKSFGRDSSENCFRDILK